MAEQIYGLIGQVMKKVGAIGKDSTATNMSGKQMYKFRGIDAVYNTLNPVMSDLGLFIVPEVLDQTREERKTTNGGTLIYSILKIKFTMYAPDGSNVSGTLIGEGMDSGDKASNKAMSIAMKYFAFQTFMIPTEELRDMDPDATVHENIVPKKDAPATVSKAAEVPKTETPATVYIRKQIRDVQAKMNLDDYETARKLVIAWVGALVKSGSVKPVDWNTIKLEEAEDLFDAIQKTFKPGEKE